MRRFKVKLTPGNLEPLAVQGDYIRITDATDEITIQPDTGAALSGMAKGMDFKAPKTFKEVKLTSDTAQSVEVMIGFGKIEDNRATINGTVDISGTVDVVNANKSRTESNQAFIFGRGLPSGASQYAYLLLANPAGSGKKIVINQLMVSSPTSAKAILVKKTDDYTALEAESGYTFQNSESGLNKNIGAAMSSGLFRKGVTTASSHTNEQIVMALDVPLNEVKGFNFTEPFIVNEGQALIVSDQKTNETIRAHFEWFEESVA